MKTRKPKDIPKSLKTIDLNAVLRKRGIFLKRNYNQYLKEMAMPLAKSMLQKKTEPVPTEAPRHPQFTNDDIKEYWQKQIHIVEIVEAQLENKLNQFIGFITKEFLKQLDSEVTSHKTFTAFVQKDFFSDNEDEFITRAQLDFTPLLETVATLAGQEANKLIGINDPYLPFNFRKQIQHNVDKFTKSLLDTDKDKLITIITDGLQDGNSVPEIRSQIVNTFDEYSKTQAQRITRTEVMRASNQASLDAYEQSGVVEGKQWATFGAIDECAQYDGQIVTLGNDFYKSDNEFQDGDPPLHPNCKCVLIPIVEGSKSYQPDNTNLLDKIADLEAKVDKRTKAFKALKAKSADDGVYMKALERHLGLSDESPSQTT